MRVRFCSRAGYAGFGALSQADQVKLNAMMDTAISGARRVVDVVRAKIDSASIFTLAWWLANMGDFGITRIRSWLTEDSANGLRVAVGAMRGVVDRLDGPDRAAVLAGTIKPERWMAAVQIVIEDVHGLAKLVDQEAAWVLAKKQVKAAMDQLPPLTDPDLWKKIAIGAGVVGGLLLLSQGALTLRALKA